MSRGGRSELLLHSQLIPIVPASHNLAVLELHLYSKFSLVPTSPFLDNLWFADPPPKTVTTRWDVRIGL